MKKTIMTAALGHVADTVLPWFAEPDASKFRAIAKFENDRGNSAALSIASPEDGAKIVSVPGIPQ